MYKLEKRALIDGRPFRLETIVEHVSDANDIVLCRSESGEMRYATVEEWSAASSPSACDGRACPVDSVKLPPVTQASTLDEKVALVMSLFVVAPTSTARATRERRRNQAN